MTDTRPTVFIVDDDPLIRTMIESLLSDAGIAAEAFDSAREFLDSFDPLRPGCLVCDVGMPEMGGLDLQQELNALGAPLAIIFITASRDVPTAVSAMQHGAVDFLLKPFSEKSLIDCVQTALSRDRDMRRALSEVEAIRECRARLTDRELEVLTYLLKGASNKTMAHELGIAQRTVELHRSNVMNKMGASSVAQLVRMIMNLERSAPRARARQ